MSNAPKVPTREEVKVDIRETVFFKLARYSSECHRLNMVILRKNKRIKALLARVEEQDAEVKRLQKREGELLVSISLLRQENASLTTVCPVTDEQGT